MSEAAKELVQRAVEIANDFQRMRMQLTKERDQAKLVVTEKQASLDATGLAIERAGVFQSSLNGDLQCPHCWIRNGVNAPLIPRGSSDPDTDLFRCRQCHTEYSFPA